MSSPTRSSSSPSSSAASSPTSSRSGSAFSDDSLESMESAVHRQQQRLAMLQEQLQHTLTASNTHSRQSTKQRKPAHSSYDYDSRASSDSDSDDLDNSMFEVSSPRWQARSHQRPRRSKSTKVSNKSSKHVTDQHSPFGNELHENNASLSTVTANIESTLDGLLSRLRSEFNINPPTQTGTASSSTPKNDELNTDTSHLGLPVESDRAQASSEPTDINAPFHSDGEQQDVEIENDYEHQDQVCISDISEDEPVAVSKPSRPSTSTSISRRPAPITQSHAHSEIEQHIDESPAPPTLPQPVSASKPLDELTAMWNLIRSKEADNIVREQANKHYSESNSMWNQLYQHDRPAKLKLSSQPVPSNHNGANRGPFPFLFPNSPEHHRALQKAVEPPAPPPHHSLRLSQPSANFIQAASAFDDGATALRNAQLKSSVRQPSVASHLDLSPSSRRMLLTKAAHILLNADSGDEAIGFGQFQHQGFEDELVETDAHDVMHDMSDFYGASNAHQFDDSEAFHGYSSAVQPQISDHVPEYHEPQPHQHAPEPQTDLQTYSRINLQGPHVDGSASFESFIAARQNGNAEHVPVPPPVRIDIPFEQPVSKPKSRRPATATVPRMSAPPVASLRPLTRGPAVSNQPPVSKQFHQPAPVSERGVMPKINVPNRLDESQRRNDDYHRAAQQRQQSSMRDLEAQQQQMHEEFQQRLLAKQKLQEQRQRAAYWAPVHQESQVIAPAQAQPSFDDQDPSIIIRMPRRRSEDAPQLQSETQLPKLRDADLWQQPVPARPPRAHSQQQPMHSARTRLADSTQHMPSLSTKMRNQAQLARQAAQAAVADTYGP